MSDTAGSKPTYKSYRLSLGLRADRYIHARGEGDIARPGARRSIHFHDCELYGIDLETETSATYIFVNERLPDQLPWPDVPWKIGEIDLGLKADVGQQSSVSIHIPPVAFQHLWDIAAEAPQKRLDVSIASQIIAPNAIWVYDVGLEVQPRTTHPVVLELRRQRQQTNAELTRAIVIALAWFVGVIVVIELIRWLWR